MSRFPAQAPDGFRYVTATREENAEWRAKHKRHSSQYRLVCTACGKRLWGSGLGIGSHRRACKGTPVTTTTEETTMTDTYTTTEILSDANVAGGWTEHGTVARRICTALWKATGAFGRITNYHSDVVLDCNTVEQIVAELEPGKSKDFLYAVGANGTMLHRTTKDEDFAFILADDRGGDSARFLVTLNRSNLETTPYGSTWGGDRFELIVRTLEAAA